MYSVFQYFSYVDIRVGKHFPIVFYLVCLPSHNSRKQNY